MEGKTIVEKPVDEDDKRVANEAEWQETKSELPYDFETKNLDFGRQKATNMKNNKRLKLPKAASVETEALLEVRRRTAARIYDECIKELGKGAELGMDNITEKERKALKSLKKKVAEGILIICQTDKSGRFCVLSREQYLKAGATHTDKDRKIYLEEHQEIQRSLNGHMRWWNTIWSVGLGWNQEARCLANLLNHGLTPCPMTLLIKDHKTWSILSREPPQTRSVMGGNVGGNTGISEFLSLVLEPVAREQEGNMEINATSGLLKDITTLNKDLRQEEEERVKKEIVKEIISGILDGVSSHQEGFQPPPEHTPEEISSQQNGEDGCPSQEQINLNEISCRSESSKY